MQPLDINLLFTKTNKSSTFDGSASYYCDRNGLETDSTSHLNYGRFALIQFKLGSAEIDESTNHLLKIKSIINETSKKGTQYPIRLPDLKIIIIGIKYRYKRDNIAIFQYKTH
ncbi:MAG: hypothetical protein RSF67_04020 [Clostridia bacterium]